MSGLSYYSRQMFATMTHLADSVMASPHPCRDEAKDITMGILSLAVLYVQHTHPKGWGSPELIRKAMQDILNGQELTMRQLYDLAPVFRY